MRYVLLNNGFCVVENGDSETIVGGTLRIETPIMCDVYVNGTKYSADSMTSYVPISALRAINSVRFVDYDRRSYGAERFKYENGCIVPCGYDFRGAIISLINSVASMQEQIVEMRRMLVEHNEAINQSELF